MMSFGNMLILCCVLTTTSAFQPVHIQPHSVSKTNIISLNEASTSIDGRISIPSTELDDALGLTQDEKTVVNVHRICSPSVVYITSVLKSPTSTTNKLQSNTDKTRLPRGTALGSGSGFVIDTTSSSCYVITNYHVIQRAYEANQMKTRYDAFVNNLGKNATRIYGEQVGRVVNRTLDSLLNDGTSQTEEGSMPAQVFIRFGSDGDDSNQGGKASYLPCEIVDVVKELDVAVLRTNASTALPGVRALTYGHSSDLLVGQTLLAIGNPFGLDRTITSGIVSALGRSVTGVAGNPIKNCIQTDASINPGNSGGPLLNMKGEVVGVNTMIISTSGSSAGIGFAVPGDAVRENTEGIIETDKDRSNYSMNRKGRGWLGVDVALGSLETTLRKRVNVKDGDLSVGAFITSIASTSPLAKPESTIHVTTMSNGTTKLGERIINFGGNDITNGFDLVKELKGRVEGEQISMTVVNEDGDRRIVYVTLGKVPACNSQ
eukprot:scaffold3932_cov87-Cyclotella_meneghiniana.AAC.5